MSDSMTVEEIVERSLKAMERASKHARRSPQAARAFLKAIGLGGNGRMGAAARPKKKVKAVRKTKA